MDVAGFKDSRPNLCLPVGSKLKTGTSGGKTRITNPDKTQPLKATLRVANMRPTTLSGSKPTKQILRSFRHVKTHYPGTRPQTVIGGGYTLQSIVRAAPQNGGFLSGSCNIILRYLRAHSQRRGHVCGSRDTCSTKKKKGAQAWPAGMLVFFP